MWLPNLDVLLPPHSNKRLVSLSGGCVCTLQVIMLKVLNHQPTKHIDPTYSKLSWIKMRYQFDWFGESRQGTTSINFSVLLCAQSTQTTGEAYRLVHFETSTR